ncbi:hypothetical protein K3217_04780 [bacterium BD-1]|nr:hypothetical protein [Ottowia caeni]
MKRTHVPLLLASLFAAPLAVAAPPEADGPTDDTPVVFHFAASALPTAIPAKGGNAALTAADAAALVTYLRTLDKS